jgi:hypothetical protein
MQNRHPADRLADVRSEIKRLEAEEAKPRVVVGRVLTNWQTEGPLSGANRIFCSF